MDGSISIRGSVFVPTRWIKERWEDIYHASSERQMALVWLLERWMLGCRCVVRLIRASVRCLGLREELKQEKGSTNPRTGKNIKKKRRAPLRMIQGVQTKSTDANGEKRGVMNGTTSSSVYFPRTLGRERKEEKKDARRI